jgi:hypothetical protein
MDMIKKQNIEGNDKAVSEIEDGRATTGCDVHPPRKESKIFKANVVTMNAMNQVG